MARMRRPPEAPSPDAEGGELTSQSKALTITTDLLAKRKYFRILDLPKELRLYIYEDALAHDRLRGISRNTALLRTNHQIHSESQETVSKVGTFGMTIAGRNCEITWYRNQGRWDWEPRVVEIEGDHEASFGEQVSCSDILSSSVSPRYPAQARKMSTIEVIIDTEAASFSARAEYLRKMQSVLYTLTTFFKNSEARTFKVILGPKMKQAPVEIQKALLYPVAKSSPTITIEFVNVADGVESHIQALRSLPYVQFDPLAQYSRLLQLRSTLKSKFAHLPKGYRKNHDQVQCKLERASHSSSMMDERSDKKFMGLVKLVLELEALPQGVSKAEFREVHEKYLRSFGTQMPTQ